MPLFRYSLLILAICTAGCMANQIRTDVSPRVQIFGVALHSDVDYREIGGVQASEEPCLKGYERSFDKLDITIGYGFNRKIRKITTRNPGTSVFGISPGMPAEDGERLARQAGLQGVAASRYQGMDINLILLVDGTGKIFGITLESSD